VELQNDGGAVRDDLDWGKAGRDAFGNGQGLDANPFPADSVDGQAWQGGWRDAEDQAAWRDAEDQAAGRLVSKLNLATKPRLIYRGSKFYLLDGDGRLLEGQQDISISSNGTALVVTVVFVGLDLVAE
jgi:hypothetical protein